MVFIFGQQQADGGVKKPVEIGDVKDSGPQSSTAKEIGIRASKTATVNSSKVPVPNGGLLRSTSPTGRSPAVCTA